MANNVEERIVQMKFDNAQFEQGIKTSMSSLESFDKSLRSKEGTQGLTAIAENVEKLSSKFSAMGIVATTALVNITNSALNAGKNIAKALTIEPITTGLNEYELKMGSVQTIMMGTGESLDVVMNKLEELNKYADRTIYSFQDMTSNIGKFTNAGVKLDVATKAIQGVSNLAAVSGAGAAEASRAMYNISQALGTGYMQLMDWKSIENANMATMEFKQTLIDTAKEMGVLNETSNVTAENFRESLNDKWLTNDVLLKTLTKYTDETTELGKKAFAAATEIKTATQLFDVMKESVQSGWAISWENIIGNFDEAKQLFTGIGQVFDHFVSKSADARNAFFSDWKNAGGRDAIIKSFYNIVLSVQRVIETIKGAFEEMFPPKTGRDIADISQKIQQFTAKLYLSKDAANGLANAIKMLLIPLKAITVIFKASINLISPIIGKIISLAGSILEMAGNAEKLQATLTKIFGVERYQRIVIALTKIFENLSNAVGRLKMEFSEIKSIIVGSDMFKNIFGDLSESGKLLKEGFLDTIVEVLEAIANINLEIPDMSKGFETAVGFVKPFVNGLRDLTSAINEAIFSGKALNYIFGAALIGIILTVGKVIKDFVASFTNIVNFGRKIIDVIDSISDVLAGFKYKLLADSALKLAVSIGILAASLLVISTIDTKSLIVAIGAITLLAGELIGMTAILTKLQDNTKQLTKIGTVMIMFSASILILASALKKLDGIQLDSLIASTLALIAVMGMLTGMTVLLSKIAPNMIKGSSSILIFAISVRVLVSAVEQLAELTSTFDLFIKGILGMVAVMGTFGLAIGVLGKLVPNFTKGAVSILAFAISARILVDVVKELSNLSFEQLGMGLLSLGGILLTLALGAGLLSKIAPKLLLSAVGIIFLATAVRILVPALEELGNMTFDQILKGIIAIAGALTVLGLTAGLLAKFSPMAILGSAAILVLAAGIRVLVPALQSLSEFSGEEIAKSLGMLAGSMLILGLTAGILGVFAPLAIAGGAAMLIMAAALRLLTPALVQLGQLSLKEIGHSLLALGAASVGLGALALVLGVLSIPALAAGVALVVLSAGIALLSPALLALSAVPLKNLNTDLGIFAMNALAAAVGSAGLAVASAGVFLYSVAVTALAGAIALLGAALNSNKNVTDMLNAGKNLVSEFLKGMKSVTADIINAAHDTVSGFINTISSKVGELFSAGVSAGKSFIDGLRSKGGIDSHSDSKQTISAAKDAISGFFNEIGRGLKDIFKAGENTGDNYIDGLEKSLNNNDVGNSIVSGIKTDINKNAKTLIDSGQRSGDIYMDAMKMALQSRGFELTSFAENMFSNASAEMRNTMLETNWGDEDWFSKISTNSEDVNDAAEAMDDLAGGITNVGDASNGASGDIKEAANSIDDLVEKAKDGIDIFSKFDDTVDIAMSDMILNISSQLKGYEKWTEGIAQITAMGFDEALVKQMAEKGMSSYKYVEALKTATMTQTVAYNYMFKEVTASADEAMKYFKENIPNISQMLTMETGKIIQIVDEAADTTENAIDVTTDVKDVVKETTPALGDLADNVELNTEAMEEATELTGEMQEGLEDITDIAKETTDGIEQVTEGTKDFGDVIKLTAEQTIEFVKGMAKIDSELETIKKSLKETIESQIDIFEKFDDESSISKEELLSNMQSQLNGVASWASGMNTLFERGIDEGLLARLRELGPEGSQYVKAFLEMTDAELSRAGQMYADSLTISDTISQQMVDKMRESGTYSVEGLLEGILSGMEPAYEAGAALATSYNAGYTETEQIQSPSVVQFNNGVNDAQGLINGINSMLAAVQNTGRAMGYALTNNFKQIANYSIFYNLGQNIGQGLANGITSMIETVASAATALAEAASSATCSVLGIASPSKLFREIGMYSDIGFANGLRDYANVVEESSRSVGETALESMRDAIKKLNDYAMSDIEEPVIRPILDLSEIQNGAKNVNSLLSKGIEMTASIATDSYRAVNAANEAKLSGNTNSEQASGAPVYNFTQNNYSPKALDRIAIYRQTNNQFSQLKGLVEGI